MAGDPAKRGAFYTQMVNLGALSPNEVRVSENRNPRDGGDDFLTPLNMRLGSEPSIHNETATSDAA